MLSVTQRRDILGLSTYTNDRIKKALLAKGLVEELSINLGRNTQGIAKFLELTEFGYRALKRKCPTMRPLNTSPEHWWWQRRIEHFYRDQGYEAEIEMALNGKRADVGLIKDGVKIAVEVGMTAKNEVVNVRRDLGAGFERVLVACRNAQVLCAVKQNLDVLTENERKRVKLILLSDFSFVRGMTRSPDAVGKAALQDI